LIQFEDHTEEFYDLIADPLELVNLLDETMLPQQQRIYESLVTGMDDLLSTEL
jgi:hypothetical protein